MASVQVCTFTVSNVNFGVSVTDVQEVLRYQEMTAVPLAPRAVTGLLNLRGQIVTAIELRRRLGLPDRDEAVLPMNVVVRTAGVVVSLLVDEIGDVIDIDEDRLEPPPETLDATTREITRAVAKLDDSLLLVMDTDKATRVDASSATG